MEYEGARDVFVPWPAMVTAATTFFNGLARPLDTSTGHINVTGPDMVMDAAAWRAKAKVGTSVEILLGAGLTCTVMQRPSDSARAIRAVPDTPTSIALMWRDCHSKVRRQAETQGASKVLAAGDKKARADDEWQPARPTDRKRDRCCPERGDGCRRNDPRGNDRRRQYYEWRSDGWGSASLPAPLSGSLPRSHAAHLPGSRGPGGV